jgi:hypothetical protein
MTFMRAQHCTASRAVANQSLISDLFRGYRLPLKRLDQTQSQSCGDGPAAAGSSSEALSEFGPKRFEKFALPQGFQQLWLALKKSYTLGAALRNRLEALQEILA